MPTWEDLCKLNGYLRNRDALRINSTRSVITSRIFQELNMTIDVIFKIVKKLSIKTNNMVDSVS